MFCTPAFYDTRVKRSCALCLHEMRSKNALPVMSELERRYHEKTFIKACTGDGSRGTVDYMGAGSAAAGYSAVCSACTKRYAEDFCDRVSDTCGTCRSHGHGGACRDGDFLFCRYPDRNRDGCNAACASLHLSDSRRDTDRSGHCACAHFHYLYGIWLCTKDPDRRTDVLLPDCRKLL